MSRHMKFGVLIAMNIPENCIGNTVFCQELQNVSTVLFDITYE